MVRAPLDAVPDLGRRFDVCLCLEVVQRVAPDAQEKIVAACARLSDVVVFSSRVPGTPGSSPHDRPLPYWAALFWRHGYVLDDSLRSRSDERWNFPQSVYDCLVIFRRQFTPEQAADPSPAGRALTDVVLRSAARIHELYTQGVWWALAAINAATPAPRSRMTRMVMPPARLAPSSIEGRVFRFRTDTARWYLTHHAATIQVFEDGLALPDVGPFDALAAAPRGGWAIWRDELTIKATDGSDPRTNGREYTVAVPSHVAWAERQPFEDSLTH